MANIHLAKPEAQASQTILSAPDGHFIFDFPADTAVLSRAGDDLLLTFEDGAVLRLQDFYTTYSKDTMPSFEVDGAQIAGEDFFMAMNEPDLMPAAGPSRAGAQSNGNRFHDYVTGDLLDGLDRLGGLDIGWPGGDVTPETDGGATTSGDDIDYSVTVTPGNPGHIDGNTPVIDNPDNPHDGGDAAVAARDVLTVNEAGLREHAPVTANGFMLVGAPDGVSSIVIGGVVVFNGTLTGATVPTDEGYLEVTGFDAASGRLDYAFHLTQATQEHKGAGADSIAHDLVVTVTDRDGSTGSGVVSVVITDDVPTIKSFTQSVTEGDAAAVTGSALDGAVAGADGANFAWTNPAQQGQYGSITLNADGTYSYTLDNNNEAVKTLSDGQTLTEEFTYTYTDADGDVAEGSLTITINGVDNGIVIEPSDPSAGSDTLTVHESGLAGGSQAGQSGAPTTAEGSLSISAPDGVASIAIGNVTVYENGVLTGNTVPTDEGVLTVTGFDAATGELKFSYALKDNTTEHGDPGKDHVSHDLTVTVTDVDGSTAGGTITVNIVDDVPTAKADSVSLTEAQAQAGGSWGNVLTNDVFGADAPLHETVTSIKGGTLGNPVSGQYGQLTLQADGTYAYRLDPDVDVPNGQVYTETFTYTITDTDGDTSEAVLTIAITGDTIVPAVTVEKPITGGADIVVDEGAQPEHGGESHAQSGSGSFTVYLHGEDGTIEVGGFTISIAGDEALISGTAQSVHGVQLSNVSASLEDGKWTVQYDYELTGGNQQHGTDAETDASLKGEFAITVTDATGDMARGSLVVEVHDDVPQVTVNQGTIDMGMDEAAIRDGASVSVSVSDQFQINPGADGMQSQNYELTLSDNAGEANKGLMAIVDGKAVPVTLGSGVDGEGRSVIVGTAGETGEPVFMVRVDAQGSVTVELLKPLYHDAQNTDTLSIHGIGVKLTVTDKDGDSSSAELDLNLTVTDDGPQLSVTPQATSGEYDTADSSVSGTFTVAFNADGPAETQSLTIDGQSVDLEKLAQGETVTLAFDGGGTLTLSKGDDEGAYAYTYTHGTEDVTFGDKIFTVVATDGDGDSTTDTITVKQDFHPTYNGQYGADEIHETVTTDESYISTGSQAGQEPGDGVGGSAIQSVVVDLHGENAETTITVTHGDKFLNFTYDGMKWSAGGEDSVAVIQGAYGELSVWVNDSENNNVTIFYEYKQTTAYDHADAATPNETAEAADSFGIKVDDKDGTPLTGTISVNIRDDGPAISIDTQATGSYGTAVTGSVDMTFGADGEKSVTVSLNNMSAEGVKGEDGNYIFTFSDSSTLTLDGASGNFSYDGVPDSGTGTSYAFTFTVTDGDGDTATATTTAVIVPKASYHGSVSSSDNDTLQTVVPSHSVELPEMPAIDSIVSGAQVEQNGEVIGQFTIAGGKLFFTQSEAYSHAAGSNSATLPAHELTIRDEYGNEHIISVDITIEDSLPLAENDIFELREHGEANIDASGNVLDNDTKSADGDTLVTEVDGQEIAADGVTEIKGELGTLFIRADGSYTYKLDESTSIPENAILREEFTYTITDADGDSSTAAALTILVGKGTVHVQESGIGLDANGKEIDILGTPSATGHVEGVVTGVEVGSTTYTDPQLADQLQLIADKPVTDGNTVTIHTNYGDLVVDTTTGEYTFSLDDDAANLLPNGFEITQGFQFTTIVEGVSTPQEVVVVIEGTNDAGQLSEAGKGGNSNNQLWIDAKAEGADSVERPYDATLHPNLGNTDSGDWGSDLNQSANGTARPTGWLPFTLQDPDVGDSLTFYAVYNNAGNVNSSNASMAGEAFVSYQELLQNIDNTPLSMALSVEWSKFQQNFSSEQLDTMQFFRNEYGIFAITNEAVELTGNNLEGAQYWLTFLVDSDADVIRNMAEGSDTDSMHGKILNFSFQVKDKTGNTVQTQTGGGNYADINHVLVHVYGSNDTPEARLEGGKLFVHDDDINNFNNEGNAGGDAESHSIVISYNGKSYTGQLGASGTLTLGNIRFTVNSDTQDGTNYTLSNFEYKSWSSWNALSGSLAITITDARGNAAIYHVDVNDGQLVEVSNKIFSDGTDEAENIYGGSGDDSLYGKGGNDSLWGGDGDDTLYGEIGNDRLYGDSGNDELYGGKGTDILVGGEGNDILNGEDGSDVLIGDGHGDLQSVIEGAVNAETFHEFLQLESPAELESYAGNYETSEDGKDELHGGAGDDLLFGMGGDDKLYGEDGNDLLYGGSGNDLLYGGSGNDYLDGGEGADTIYGGAGNDIIVYDATDLLVNGGSGIDIMVSNQSDLTLDTLLGGGEGKPVVQGVEALITGEDALSLTSMDQLAENYGITIGAGEDGKETLTLDMTKWNVTGSGTYTFNGAEDLTLQLDMRADAALQKTDSDEAAQQVFILQNSNG